MKFHSAIQPNIKFLSKRKKTSDINNNNNIWENEKVSPFGQEDGTI